MKKADDLEHRAKRVKMILMDVDGVLTDGKIVFLSGGAEAKMFDSKDGVGIKLAQRAGLKISSKLLQLATIVQDVRPAEDTR